MGLAWNTPKTGIEREKPYLAGEGGAKAKSEVSTGLEVTWTSNCINPGGEVPRRNRKPSTSWLERRKDFWVAQEDEKTQLNASVGRHWKRTPKAAAV